MRSGQRTLAVTIVAIVALWPVPVGARGPANEARDFKLIQRLFQGDASAWRQGHAAGVREIVMNTDPVTRSASGTSISTCSGAFHSVIRREFVPDPTTIRRLRTMRSQWTGRPVQGRLYRVRGSAETFTTFRSQPFAGHQTAGVVVRKGHAYFFPSCRVSSPNWAGWVTHDASVSRVSGRWSVPTVRCERHRQAAMSMWVGLGGTSSNADLLQTGIEVDCTNAHRTILVFSQHGQRGPDRVYRKIRVRTGDAIRATVSRRAQRSTVRLSVNGVVELAGTFDPPLGTTMSAECIAENPARVDGAPSSFARFDRGVFTSCRATADNGARPADPRRWLAYDVFAAHRRRSTVTGLPTNEGGFVVARLSS